MKIHAPHEPGRSILGRFAHVAILVAAFLLSAFAAPDLAAQFAVTKITPASQVADVGTPFSVNVEFGVKGYVTNGMQIWISFDPTKLQVVSINTGSSSPYTTVLANAYNNTAGTLTYRATGGNVANYTFNAATIVFMPIAAGTSPIYIQNVNQYSGGGVYGINGLASSASVTINAAAQLFFTDALTGPSSPNLATIPAAKYAYTAAGLQRTQSSGTTDRPIVATAQNSYLTAQNFTAEVTVTLASNDLLYFGLGQGDMDPGYFNEPNHAFYFRVHSGWQGNYSIQADARGPGVFTVTETPFGSYALGSTITLRIVRAGDSVTMSVVGRGSVTYSLAAYPALGLTNSNTRVFFGNSTAGSVFSNLAIYEATPDTTPPVIAVPADLTAEATGASGAVVTFAATAEDDVDGPVGVLADPASGSTFPLGATIVDLAASDEAGNIASAAFTVTVEDTTPPAITAPASQTLEATSAAGATATFAAAATDIVDGAVNVLANPASGSTFPVGTTTVDLAASDAAGNVASAAFAITVEDTTAPVIASVAPSTATLWPPNHQMVPVTISAQASDATGVTSLKIIGVTSSEPDNGLGDGDTANDIQITGNLTVSLRAERSGKGNGRTYTITVEARDAHGNASTRTCTVSVPKSKGR